MTRGRAAGLAGERALAIAAPYAAAVLEAMGLSVTRLDGADLTKVAGPFDVIVCEGAVSATPRAASLRHCRHALSQGVKFAILHTTLNRFMWCSGPFGATKFLSFPCGRCGPQAAVAAKFSTAALSAVSLFFANGVRLDDDDTVEVGAGV